MLEDLRARIRKLERQGAGLGDGTDPAVLPFAVEGIDEALPWGGLPRACLHEFGGGGAATGFCAALLARIAGPTGAVLWCRRTPGLYGPGLAAFGLDADRLVVARARNDDEIFWAMEEGLRSASLAAVLGETTMVTPTIGRRLQLAAESGATTAFLLRPRVTGAPTPVATRWRVSPAPSRPAAGNGVGACRWQVELLRCRGAVPQSWLVEWDDEATGGFTLVTDLRHRPGVAAADGVRAAG